MRRKFWNVFGFYRDIVNTRDAGELLIGVFVEPGDGHVAAGAGVWRRRRPRDRACCGRSDVDDDRLGHRVDISATVAPARRLRPAAAVEAHRLARAQFRRRWRRRRWGDVSSWIYYRSRWRRRGAHVALRSLLNDSPGLYAYCCTLMSAHKSQKNIYPNIRKFYVHVNCSSGSILLWQHCIRSRFYRAMLCIRGTSHGPVSLCPSVCLSATSRSRNPVLLQTPITIR